MVADPRDRDHGTTVVLVTHFMDEAEHLCDRLAVVDAGRVVAIDTPQGLIDGLGLRRRTWLGPLPAG